MLNKHGIPIQIVGKKRKQKSRKLEQGLQTKTFIKIVDDIEVTAMIADFSPICEVLVNDGWAVVEIGDNLGTKTIRAAN